MSIIFFWRYLKIKYFFAYRIDWEEDIIKANSKNKINNTPTINSTNVLSGVANATTSSESILEKREEFIIIYLCIVLFGVVSYLSRSFSFYFMCLRIATNMHDMIFRSVDRAKMIFFNANPSGRILNRFAKDMYRVDTSLPIILADVFDVSKFKLKCTLHLMLNYFIHHFVSISASFTICSSHCDWYSCESMAFDYIYNYDRIILFRT